MAEKIRIRGRKEWGGVYEGEALVSKAPIMGWCNCDIRHGYTSEHAHPLFKVPMKGKVLVFDTQRGSGGFTMYGTASLLGTGPAAYVHTAKCALTVSNAQMARVPHCRAEQSSCCNKRAHRYGNNGDSHYRKPAEGRS